MLDSSRRDPTPSSPPPAPTAGGAEPMSRRAVQIALLVASAFFMEMLDGTVIVTALPQMANSFGVNPVDLTMGMTAYMLTLAVFIPLSGWFADRFGARRIFTLALVIFTLASVLCAFATGPWTFTMARIVQGFGGSMMVPVGRLAVLRTTPKHHLIRAIAFVTWPGLIAPVIGPAVGGFLTTYFDWRWIFWLNVPLGIIAIALSLVLIPAGDGDDDRPLDWTGFVLSAVACLAFTYGLNLFGNVDVPVLLASGLVVLGIAAGFATVKHARQHPSPLIDVSSMSIPTYSVSIIGGTLLRTIVSTSPFLLALMFQIGFGMDAFEAGLLVLAVFVGNVVIKPVTTPILRALGFRTLLLANGLLFFATVVGCAFLTPETPRVLLLLLLFVNGASRSTQFTAVATIAFADVPQERMSGANTLFSLMFQLSNGLSVAISAVCLKLASLSLGHPAGSLTLTDFRLAFLLTGVLVLIGLIDSYMLPPNAGESVSKKPR